MKQLILNLVQFSWEEHILKETTWEEQYENIWKVSKKTG